MFTGQAVKYYDNFAFRMKLMLIVLAGINMLVFHFVTWRGIAAWDRAPAPLSARLAGANFARLLDRHRRLRAMDRLLHVLSICAALRCRNDGASKWRPKAACSRKARW